MPGRDTRRLPKRRDQIGGVEKRVQAGEDVKDARTRLRPEGTACRLGGGRLRALVDEFVVVRVLGTVSLGAQENGSVRPRSSGRG